MSILQRVDHILISGGNLAAAKADPHLYCEVEMHPSSIEMRIKDRWGHLIASYCLDYHQGRLQIVVDDVVEDDDAAHLIKLYVAPNRLGEDHAAS